MMTTRPARPLHRGPVWRRPVWRTPERAVIGQTEFVNEGKEKERGREDQRRQRRGFAAGAEPPPPLTEIAILFHVVRAHPSIHPNRSRLSSDQSGRRQFARKKKSFQLLRFLSGRSVGRSVGQANRDSGWPGGSGERSRVATARRSYNPQKSERVRRVAGGPVAVNALLLRLSDEPHGIQLHFRVGPLRSSGSSSRAIC